MRENNNIRFLLFITLPVGIVILMFILILIIGSVSSRINKKNAGQASGSGSAYDNYAHSGTDDYSGNKAGADESGNQSAAGGDNTVKYIFVGDSRYVGMKKYAQSDDIFIAKVGEGYSYLNSNLNLILEYADKNSILIVGLGVNDYAMSYKNYIKTMNELADTLECKVYYMLINPVDEEKIFQYGYSVTNDAIDRYNALMVAGFDNNVGVIDTNSYLKEDGFLTLGGLHYDDITYKKIYNYLKSHAL